MVIVSKVTLRPRNWYRGANKKAGPADRPQYLGATPLLVDDHQRAYLLAVVEIDDVLIGEADAARRHGLADRPRLRRSVQPVQRRADIERAGAERIVRAAGHVGRQVGRALAHFRRRRPAGPLGLASDGVLARPAEAVAADAEDRV